ncbi:unnamed protein product [Ectocarpus sp. 8 AP-2014]
MRQKTANLHCKVASLLPALHTYASNISVCRQTLSNVATGYTMLHMSRPIKRCPELLPAMSKVQTAAPWFNFEQHAQKTTDQHHAEWTLEKISCSTRCQLWPAPRHP